MHAQRRQTQRGRQGYSLFAVTVFTVVVIVTCFAFFASSSYETRQALYRQDSSEAFYLADGAVERARARFLADRAWRTGWSAAPAGRGEYDLTVRDTTFQGQDNVVQLVATGRVQQAQRRIEVMAKIPPTAFGLPLLIMRDADVGGNLCLSGSAHVSGNPDFGPHDVHLSCEGDYTTGFDIAPPPIYTDPGHYPDATYYYVRGNLSGGVYHARIFNAAGQDLTTALGDSLIDLMTYDAGTGTFGFHFDSDARINHYFDDTTGIFRRNPGDAAVVVNFGEPPLINPPGLTGVSYLEIDGGVNTIINTTLINTRFTGVTVEQRLDSNYWLGGRTVVKQIEMAPYHGVAAIAYDFQKVGGSLVNIGTTANPALVYVTRDVVDANSNFELLGSIICLGDWTSTGGPNVTYDEGFMQFLPDYLLEDWPGGVSGTLSILRWREIAGSGP